MANLDESYLKNLGDINTAFAPVNNQALTESMKPGGSFANSLGFGEGGGIDVTGLTPESLGQVMTGRSNILNQNLGAVKSAVDLADLVSGGKEHREALRTAQNNIFQANTAKAAAENSHIFEQGMQDKRLVEEWKRLNTEIGARASEGALTRAESAREHNITAGIAQQRLDVEKHRQAVIDKAMLTDPVKLQTTFPPSEGMYGKLQAEKDAYAKKNILGEGDRKNFAVAHLKQQALGTEYGTIYNANTYKDVLGYGQLRLGPSGWYGITKDPKTGAVTYSANPVVPFSATGVPIKGGSAKSKGLYDVYGGGSSLD
jgi:soluble cytochrome b562